MGGVSFDEVAELYDAVRPAYPEQLFDDLLAIAATPDRGRVIDVGAGTGQATEQLARRGPAVTLTVRSTVTEK